MLNYLAKIKILKRIQDQFVQQAPLAKTTSYINKLRHPKMPHDTVIGAARVIKTNITISSEEFETIVGHQAKPDFFANNNFFATKRVKKQIKQLKKEISIYPGHTLNAFLMREGTGYRLCLGVHHKKHHMHEALTLSHRYLGSTLKPIRVIEHKPRKATPPRVINAPARIAFKKSNDLTVQLKLLANTLNGYTQTAVEDHLLLSVIKRYQHINTNAADSRQKALCAAHSISICDLPISRQLQKLTEDAKDFVTINGNQYVANVPFIDELFEKSLEKICKQFKEEGALTNYWTLGSNAPSDIYKSHELNVSGDYQASIILKINERTSSVTPILVIRPKGVEIASLTDILGPENPTQHIKLAHRAPVAA